MKGILIPADGSLVSVAERDLRDEREELQWMYEVIGCQYVEMVVVTDQLTLWVDEEGLLKEAPVLNAVASFLAKTRIAGNALLLGGVTRFGTTRGLTDQQIEAMILR